MELIALVSLLGLSLVGHALQFRHYSRQTKLVIAESQKALADPQKKRALDVSAEELLRDLVSSGAIVRIERIDPGSLLLWRGSN